MDISKNIASIDVSKNTDVLLRLPDVIKIVGLSKSSLYSRLDPRSPMFDPKFPKKIKLFPGRTVVWSRNELEKWLKSHIEIRDC